MRRPALVALILAVLAGAARGATLEGRVVEDHTGKPVVAAEVRVRRVGTANLAADLETDAEGRFPASDLAPGEYQLDVSKANYVATRLRLRLPAAALQIRLVRTGVITGRVTSPDGRSRRGMVFAMVKPPGDLPWQRSSVLAAVAETGQYRLHGLPPGRYVVALSCATFNPGGGSGAYYYPDNSQPRIFTISGGEELQNVDFALPPGPFSAVSGKVASPTPGARFAVSLYPSSQPGLAAANVWTGPDGAFRLEGVPPGSYELAVAGPATGYGQFTSTVGPDPVFGWIHVEVTGTDVEGLSIPVAKGRSAAFMLRAADGCPSAATLRLAPLEASGTDGLRGVELNAGKERSVAGLAPGHYQVLATSPGDDCYAASKVLDLTAGDASDVVVVDVKPAGSIRGRLASGSTVGLLAVDETQSIQTAYPDGEGRFTFPGLRPGRYRIAATPRTMRLTNLARMFEIEVSGGSTTEVDLPPAQETEGDP